jgi:hypothetical protein
MIQDYIIARPTNEVKKMIIEHYNLGSDEQESSRENDIKTRDYFLKILDDNKSWMKAKKVVFTYSPSWDFVSIDYYPEENILSSVENNELIRINGYVSVVLDYKGQLKATFTMNHKRGEEHERKN